MSAPPFYMLAYDTDGALLKKNEIGEWQFWNDACWDRCVPKDCTGLTYLDIGCSDGVFPLRFWQRGGRSTGLAPEKEGEIYPGIEAVNTPGKNHPSVSASWLRDRFAGKYDILVGGFAKDGDIRPYLGRFNIVSCLNVLEYLPNPFECIRDMFNVATDMVIIATDINDRETTRHRLHNNVTVFLPSDISRLSSWECRFFRLPLEINRSPEPQGFWCFTKPGGVIAPPDTSAVAFDARFKLSTTQKTYLDSRK